MYSSGNPAVNDCLGSKRTLGKKYRKTRVPYPPNTAANAAQPTVAHLIKVRRSMDSPSPFVSGARVIGVCVILTVAAGGLGVAGIGDVGSVDLGGVGVGGVEGVDDAGVGPTDGVDDIGTDGLGGVGSPRGGLVD